MSLSLPGYYYDEVKKKYFKIEKSHSAPASAAWSAANVKRRKLENEHTAAKHARSERTKRNVKRARALREPLLGGFLDRQLGIGAPDAEVSAAVWALGLVDRHHVGFVDDSRRGAVPNLGCLWVGGEDTRTGVGVAYTSLSESSSVRSTYIHTDSCGIVGQRTSPTQQRITTTNVVYEESVQCNQVSSISYHQPSHRMLVTTREPSNDPGVHFFSPRVTSPTEDRPHWELGSPRLPANHYKSVRMAPGRRTYSVNLATPAPTASSELMCTLATDDGIIRLTSNSNISWITPKADGAHQRPLPMDVLAQAFNVANPSILYAGTRSSTVRTLDLRAPPQAWSCFRAASAVTHLRSLDSNPNHILVAALRSNLHIYDLRFLKTEPSAQTRSEVPRMKKRNRGRDHGRSAQPSGPAVVQPATPVLTFPEYRNEAHTHIGFDVNQDVGVVAAAHDTHDGRVALYSLRSGLRLRAPAVDRASTRGPVRSLVFQSMPMERHASLWIGHQGVVKKYSVGVSGEDDEA
ncbi:hypothetical protein VD0002_g3977 [Verticillium dahliae]|uniref:Myocyte-specific enhancer factor 2d n=2 Tax=Verticillium dahliae TaxID=27337 RepID=G2X121_VERDV|nr:uncharacterized protein VDAG_03950 [Verticillium dahliae VdLs.17]KAH6704937.1 hypothetical protein EV126DRAFT_335608 [Verticillium dahliae]EGY22512.1 hypothetical protein VDAG_03950 [Verticillium dahliae VdLs.17]PNH31637.1 hypothetical protein BJF96_g5015 [Verticillium dahliae]PNH56619.1 hypothetical protein VD0003_g1156 [Verticillium dahliae]PNH64818.1 hypothetical protein VD0002_g3977 [Verticillium dahliae]